MTKELIDKILRFLKNLLWLLPFLLIAFLVHHEDKKLAIKHSEDFKKEKYSGKIEKKYIDQKQHGYEMLVISKTNGRDSSEYNSEQSGFWDFVQINDSILKKENSNEIYIINKDTSFIINYYNVGKMN